VAVLGSQRIFVDQNKQMIKRVGEALDRYKTGHGMVALAVAWMLLTPVASVATTLASAKAMTQSILSTVLTCDDAAMMNAWTEEHEKVFMQIRRDGWRPDRMDGFLVVGHEALGVVFDEMRGVGVSDVVGVSRNGGVGPVLAALNARGLVLRTTTVTVGKRRDVRAWALTRAVRQGMHTITVLDGTLRERVDCDLTRDGTFKAPLSDVIHVLSYFEAQRSMPRWRVDGILAGAVLAGPLMVFGVEFLEVSFSDDRQYPTMAYSPDATVDDLAAVLRAKGYPLTPSTQPFGRLRTMTVLSSERAVPGDARGDVITLQLTPVRPEDHRISAMPGGVTLSCSRGPSNQTLEKR
jgi:hypothetical protein